MARSNKRIDFTQEQLNEMVCLHDSGMLNKDIAKHFNISRSTIDRRLASMNVVSRHPCLTDERKKLAIKAYSKCHNISAVAKEINMSEATIHNILDEAGVHINSNAENHIKCHVNESYFEVIDTPRKSYYLGLLYADGCATQSNRHGIKISLQAQDGYIIETFNDDIESDYKIRLIEYSKKNPNWSDQYSLCITNQKFYNNLVNHGMVPNKSLVLQFPEFLEPFLYPSFLLGYMDGDGSISKNECRISMISTLNFCQRVAEIVDSELGVHASISKCHGKDTATRCLGIAGRRQVKKFLDWLYLNSDIWLDRKYQIYQEKYCS